MAGGNYVLVETAVPTSDYVQAAAIPFKVDAEGQIQVADAYANNYNDSTHTITLNNQKKTGSLTVKKIIEDGEADTAFDFTVTFTNFNNGKGGDVTVTRKGKAVFGDKINHAGDVFDLARSGDEQALKIVDDMAYDLAMMFCAIGHIIDPHVFVVGGGVMKGKDVFFEKMESYYRSMIHVGMQPVVFKEALLDEPGIIGAAMLPMTHLK